MTDEQFQDLCEFVELAVFEDATYLGPQYTLIFHSGFNNLISHMLFKGSSSDIFFITFYSYSVLLHQ